MTSVLLLLALVQTPIPDDGRASVEALEFPDLTFTAPEVGEYEVLGVPVFHLQDETLPLVDIEVLMVGGVGRLGRDALASLTALPVLLRTGGTAARTPSEVERELDLMALQIGVGSGGGGTSVTMNAPRRRIEPAFSLLAEILLEPSFGDAAVEAWRAGEIGRLRRRRADSGSVAFTEFNRLLYADGPTGWTLDESDLGTDTFTSASVREVHTQVACRDRLYVGLSGDISWAEARPMLEAFLARWPECAGPLPPLLQSVPEADPGVYLVPVDGSQSTIVAAHPSPTRLGDSGEYFASRVADFVLGSGGISSRIVSHMRSQAGLVYQAASVWTTPLRQPGLVGGFAATGSENTVRTTEALVSVLAEFMDEPPTDDEIEAAVQAMQSAFVFAFDTPARIVSRRIVYRVQGLPDDWLTRYLTGLESVDRTDVAAVVASTIDPSRLTILVAGDPESFEPGIEGLGPVYVRAPNGSYAARDGVGDPLGGSPRSPR